MSDSRPASQGVVRLAALDLRARPDHRGELKSQLLMGEVVRFRSATRDRRWWRVENRTDGYTGWVRTWGLVPASAARAAVWRRKARTRIVVPFAEVRAGRRRDSPLLTPLFLNCRVIGGRSVGRQREVELPDGRRGWLDRRHAVTGGGRPDLAARVRGLLGVPYLWGGRTPLGWDCSAFTQQVLAEQGVRLPRDADQQFRVSRALKRGEEPRSGDLIFFGRGRGRLEHVGLVLGGGYFAHARGEVRINSIDRHNILWDNALGSQFRGFGRPRKGPI
jgi:cell wall-associated NlpC family hydrolase